MLGLDKLSLWLHNFWAFMHERFSFLPALPDHLDALALTSLLLIAGLLIGETLHQRFGWPKIIGYVLAGTLFGPAALGWLDQAALLRARPLADAALGLLMMEVGRRLDLGWMRRNPELIRSSTTDIGLSFLLIFGFAHFIVGLAPVWAAATAAVTMASAPTVVMLVIEDSRAQGQVSERMILHTAIGAAASFIAFAIVLGFVHAENSRHWSVIAHPLWVAAGALLAARLCSWLALRIARFLPKRSLAQVFILIACAMLAVGLARMLAVPVYLTLFLMGALVTGHDKGQTLRYTNLPEAHWLLAIILFVIVGATLPWREFTGLAGLQAIGLITVRAIAKMGALAISPGSLPLQKRLLVGIGIQPLSATAVFMASEIASLYPEVGAAPLTLPLFAAAIMELLGPALCRLAIRRSGEGVETDREKGGLA